MEIQVAKLRDDAALPAYATEGAAGADICACITHAMEIGPGQRGKVPTGLAIAVPTGFEAQVRPRSGLASNHGITVLNSPGTIDSDYRGELFVLVINHGNKPFEIVPHMRIAQLVVYPCFRATWKSVDKLNSTSRGSNGFGSSGN
jgi:dUTP pyrophosphatase